MQFHRLIFAFWDLVSNREFDKRSKHLFCGDHLKIFILFSLDYFIVDIFRRKLMLVTLYTLRVKGSSMPWTNRQRESSWLRISPPTTPRGVSLLATCDWTFSPSLSHPPPPPPPPPTIPRGESLPATCPFMIDASTRFNDLLSLSYVATEWSWPGRSDTVRLLWRN